MIFLRRPIDKLSSSHEAHPTFMHPAFGPGNSHHRPAFAVFVTETPSDDEKATTRMGNTTSRNNKTCGADKEHEKKRDFLKKQAHSINVNSNNITAKTPSPKHGLHHSFLYQRQPQQATTTTTTTTTTTVPKSTAAVAADNNNGNNNTVIVEKPRIQQTESNERISIALDVAGYTLNDLQIKIDGRILTIAGQRRNRIGMTFTFSRRLGLKIARLEMGTLRANLVEGVLEVTVDKKKITQQNKMSRVIPITSISAATTTTTTTTTTSSDEYHCGGNDTVQEAKSRLDEPSSAIKDSSSITDQHQQPEAESVGSVEGEESTSGRTSSLGSVATPVETVTEQDDDDDDDSDTPSSSSISADKQGQSMRVYAEDDEKANVEEEASATTSENNHRSGSEEEEQPDGESWENVVIDMFGDGK